MNHIVDFILQYKDFILVAIIVVLLAVMAGKKNVKVFVESNLKTLEKEVIESIAKNPTAYASIIYGKLPVALKAFASISTIEKIVAKFLDK